MARKRDGLESSAEERILLLQKGLDRKADAACKEWWEGYLKNVIPFRGVKMADIRTVMHMWISDHHVDQLTVARQRGLALGLIRQTFSEDKMAGILFLQEVLVPNHAIRLAEPERVIGFVETRIASFNREGLRYALEKSLSAEKKRLHNLLEG